MLETLKTSELNKYTLFYLPKKIKITSHKIIAHPFHVHSISGSVDLILTQLGGMMHLTAVFKY